MVADTYDPLLGLLEMGTGNQNNSWGSSFNSSVTTPIGRAVAGAITRSNTGGALDLSGSPPPAAMRQDIDAIQIFNGALVSDLTVTVPNLSKIWDVGNFTSGSFSLFFKTAAGTAVQVPQGCRRRLIADGANNIYREDRDEVGKFSFSGRTTAAPGELACSGNSVLRASYPDLFTAIGTTWGSVDGTHFTLPNLTDTNRFLRAAGGAVAVGTYQANQNLAHVHGVTGSLSSGTLSTDSQGSHTHSANSTDSGHTHGYQVGLSASVFGGGGFAALGSLTAGTTGTGTANITTTITAAGAHTHNVTGIPGLGTLAIVSQGGTEARPESAAALITIKY